MPVKEWFRNLQPIQLYIVLFLTATFFVTELICSHLTHSLTLLMNSYHMLCNILALTGCIVTIKYSKTPKVPESSSQSETKETTSTSLPKTEPGCADKPPSETKNSPTRSNQAWKLKNTFGWARIDVISMLICGIFMMSLSFSVLVEALQTLVHINHFDEMHHALSVLFFGAAGLLLNGVCYLLIGGYTFHQGSYMFLTESGDVVLSKVVVPDIVNQGGRRLSRTRTTMPSPPSKQRQGFWEMIRDTSGCVLVIVCALIVYFTEKNIAKFIDPGISLLSATSLMILSYPYMKESCLILLQTIPGSINIDALEKDLIRHFPDIVNVHDFHVWQLTATKIISTVHIIFQNQEEYRKIMDDIKKFLVENGITQVTIQPEFFTKFEKKSTELCLMPCQRKECQLSHCCPPCPKVKETKVESNEGSFPDLRSIRIVNTDFAKTTDCLSATESQSPDNI